MPDDSENPIAPQGRMINSAPGSQAHPGAADDAALLASVRSGDQDAMGRFYDRYSTLVYSVALRILHDTAQAEDVTQEVFIHIWRHPDSFVSGRGALGAWLVVIARNRSIDVLRRRRPNDSVDDVVLASSTDLASEAERNTLMERIRGILKDLPGEQQRSVEMAFFEGLSHTEIAERTGQPLGTVKTRIRLALLSLRKALQR